MKKLRSTLLAASAFLTGVGLVGPTWAACLDPMALNWDGKKLNSMYTDVDGKLEGCPADYPNLCEIPKDGDSCTMYSVTTGGADVMVEVTRSSDGRYETLCWFEDPDNENDFLDQSDDCENVALFDYASTKGGQSANACIYSFDQDAASFSAGFDGAGFFGAFLCGDDVYEYPVTPPPPALSVESCILQDGQSISIYGVSFTCGGVPENELRTIIVSKDLECVGDNCAPPPSFGFANDDGIPHFQNFCICYGPGKPVEDPQCDPNPDVTNDPVTDSLEPCLVERAFPAVEISIQNPRCVTVAGDRRCY